MMTPTVGFLLVCWSAAFGLSSVCIGYPEKILNLETQKAVRNDLGLLSFLNSTLRLRCYMPLQNCFILGLTKWWPSNDGRSLRKVFRPQLVIDEAYREETRPRLRSPKVMPKLLDRVRSCISYFLLFQWIRFSALHILVALATFDRESVQSAIRLRRPPAGFSNANESGKPNLAQHLKVSSSSRSLLL